MGVCSIFCAVDQDGIKTGNGELDVRSIEVARNGQFVPVGMRNLILQRVFKIDQLNGGGK